MIGVTAPILLTSLRFVQGLAIGGQWGGAMLLVTESAPSDKRGFYGAFAQAGAPIGVILANLAFIVTSSLVSEESFYSWGWRIPFLASAILIGISMYIQLTMEDTKAFQELQAARENQQARGYQNNNVIKKSPIIEAIKKYPGRISLAAGAFLSVQVTFYILIAFMLAYGVTSAGMERDEMLFAVLIGSAIIFLTLNSFACFKTLVRFLFVESKIISKFFLSCFIIFNVFSPIFLLSCKNISTI